ncbi:MAG: dTDP-4-dehydrorhamnose reductase [Candidatus Cloacimonetes bacterium]|nr:dTDP-4-dehydrorhamnose reductase [Candidatus Cloacimonadota bacterium]MDD4155630.1 dTDP-4-dehydrorhamnose reductase [Candidatus Cloacimonadota bacterium]
MSKFIIFGANGMLANAIRNNQFFNDNISFNSKDGDITNFKLIEGIIKKHKPKYLINCAAYTDVTKAEIETDRAFQVNAEGSKNLAILSKESNCKLIHFSTDYVFKGNKNIEYTEDMPVDPVNVYGASKAKGEEYILKYAPKSLIIRVSWLYGTNGKNFVSTISKIMRERNELKIVSDQFGKTTYTIDATEATIDLISKDLEGIFHYANDGINSRFDFTKKIYEYLNNISSFECDIKPISSDEYPDNTPRPKWSILNTSKYCIATNKRINHWNNSLFHFLNNMQAKTIE